MDTSPSNSKDWLKARIVQKLQTRRFRGSLRSLKIVEPSFVDLCSNDYLGFARVKGQLIHPDTSDGKLSGLGSTGSRLISGNSQVAENLERQVAEFHRAQAGLLFNSGYDANLGLLASLPQRGDVVLYDQLVHASIRDGLRLSFANSYGFRHNDVEHLQLLLERFAGKKMFIVVESLYSMDGDLCPLKVIVQLAERFAAQVVVDEAHASGVIGPQGRGLVAAENLSEKVFARVHTFGKALGAHGAIILGTESLREYLINFARSLIYTTALPIHSLSAISFGYQLNFERGQQAREELAKLIDAWQMICRTQFAPRGIIASQNFSPIQYVLIPDNKLASRCASLLQQQAIDVRAILSPTVTAGKERLRVCLHAYNQAEDLQRLSNIVVSALDDKNSIE